MNKPEPSTIWEREYDRVSPTIDQYKKELSKKPKTKLEILRVNQLDAIRLDAEINEILSSQFTKIFAFFKPDLVQKFKPELFALLDLLVYRCSIYVVDTTYGKKLQNLKYANSDASPLTMWQKLLYGFITIGGKWFWTRLNTWATSRDNWGNLGSSNVWKLLNYLDTTFKVTSVLNFLVFLYDGKYVSIINRLLGMRLVYESTITSGRSISFEYMNRQLVWHGFTEFLMFFLPLVNVEKIKNVLSRTFYSPIQGASIPEFACPICKQDPVQTPFVANCGHLFCYFCIKQNMMMDSKFDCPRCRTVVTDIKRYKIESEDESEVDTDQEEDASKEEE